MVIFNSTEVINKKIEDETLQFLIQKKIKLMNKTHHETNSQSLVFEDRSELLFEMYRDGTITKFSGLYYVITKEE